MLSRIANAQTVPYRRNLTWFGTTTLDGPPHSQEDAQACHEMTTALPAPPKGFPRASHPVAANGARSRRPRLRTWLIALFPLLQPMPACADIIVGVAAPTNESGREIRRAAQAAAKRINAEGGVLGERIAVIEADDGCNAEQGARAAQSLVKRRVVVVIGHPCASAAGAAGPVYASNNVVLLGMTTHPALTEKRSGSTIFRVAGRDDRQGPSAAAYLLRNFPGSPIAVVRDASRYARRITNDARTALNEAGFTEVLNAAVWGGQKDYTKLIAKLKTANTEALFFAGFPIEAGLFLRQMRAAGLSTAFIGSETLATAQFTDTAGPAASGARILMSHDPARRPAAPRLMDARDRRPATGPFLLTSAAIEAWLGAAQQAGSSAPDAVSAALNEGTFETVLGPVSFADNGDANRPAFDVVTWTMDAWRVVDRGQ